MFIFLSVCSCVCYQNIYVNRNEKFSFKTSTEAQLAPGLEYDQLSMCALTESNIVHLCLAPFCQAQSPYALLMTQNWRKPAQQVV